MVKHFTEAQIDDLIKLKYGSLVTSANNKQFVSNAVLSKIFDISAHRVRELYMERFKAINAEKEPLLVQLQKQAAKHK